MLWSFLISNLCGVLILSLEQILIGVYSEIYIQTTNIFKFSQDVATNVGNNIISYSTSSEQI